MANIPTSEMQQQGDPNVYQLIDHRIPALANNAGKRLAVNTNGDGFEFVDKEVVCCSYIETDPTNHTGTVSLSVAEINAAASAGKIVLLKQGSSVYYLTWKDNLPIFSNNFGLNFNQILYNTQDSKWHKTTMTASTAQVFVCFLTYGNGEYSCNETIQDISSAYQTGKIVVCVFDSYEYYCHSCNSSRAVFVRTSSISANQNNISEIGFSAIVYSSSAWHYYGNMNVQPLLVGSGNGQNIKTVLGTNILESGNIDNVGVCDSAEYADILTATVPGFTLRDGAVIHIRFEHGIKWDPNQQIWNEKTLNINNTGAKYLRCWGMLSINNGMFTDYCVASLVYLKGNFDDPTASAHYPEGYYIIGTTFDAVRLNRVMNYKQEILTTSYHNVIYPNTGTITVPSQQYSSPHRAIVKINNTSITGCSLSINAATVIYPVYVLIDNSSNINDIVITIENLKFNGTVLDNSYNIVMSPSLKTTEGRKVKAGESMELEYIVNVKDNVKYALVKRTL